MNFSQITDNLLVGTTPSLEDYKLLRNQGVTLVINMRFWRGHRPTSENSSLHYLRLRTFDNPLLPIPMRALVRGARAALNEIEHGGKVYTHCARGRHRGAAMGAAILIAQGLSAERAIGLIKERRAVADPCIFYIRRRILLFARRWTLLNTSP